MISHLHHQVTTNLVVCNFFLYIFNNLIVLEICTHTKNNDWYYLVWHCLHHSFRFNENLSMQFIYSYFKGSFFPSGPLIIKNDHLFLIGN